MVVALLEELLKGDEDGGAFVKGVGRRYGAGERAGGNLENVYVIGEGEGEREGRRAGGAMTVVQLANRVYDYSRTHAIYIYQLQY